MTYGTMEHFRKPSLLKKHMVSLPEEWFDAGSPRYSDFSWLIYEIGRKSSKGNFYIGSSSEHVQIFTIKNEEEEECRNDTQSKGPNSKDTCTDEDKISQHNEAVQEVRIRKCSTNEIGFFHADTIYVDELGVARSLHVQEIPIQMAYDQGFSKIVGNTKPETSANNKQIKE